MTKIRTIRTIRDVRLKTSAGDSLRSLFEVERRGVVSIEIADGMVVIRGDLPGEDAVGLPLSSVDYSGLQVAQPPASSQAAAVSPHRGR